MADNPGKKLVSGLWLLCIGCVLIAIGLSLGGRWNAPKWWPLDDKGFHLEWKHGRGGFGNVASSGEIPETVKIIDVSLAAAGLTVTRGTEARNRLTGFDTDGVEVRAEGDTLKIEEHGFAHSINLGGEFARPRVEIEIPEGMKLDKCEISLGAGALSLDGIASREIRVESGAGAVRGTGLDADRLDAKSGAGNVEFTDSRFGETDIQTAAGRVAVKASLGEKTTISTGAGAIELTLPGSPDDWRFEFERGVGVVRIGDETFTGIGNGTAGNRNAAKTVRLSSGVGAVMVGFGE
jgi:hypothetical protein